MNDKEIEKKWPELKQKILQLHPEFTREELALEIGKEAELLKRLQKKLGKTDSEIRNWLSIMG